MQFEINENNELVLVESRTMRDEHVYRDNVLDKVKFVSTLGDRNEVTLDFIANYYETPIDTIRTIVKRHRDEFNDYEELRILKGKSLKEFKALVQLEPDLKTAPSLTLLTRRGMLRIGMLLRDSLVAKQIRHYLLNVEEVSDKEQKAWAVQRTISIMERKRLTDAIKYYFTGSLGGHEYSTFTNLAYKILFDADAKKLKEYYGLDKHDNLRDNLSTEDLRKIVEVETTMAVLMKLGKSYHEIKDELIKNQDKYR